METSKKSKTKADANHSKEQLVRLFREHLLTNGKIPVSVFSFTKEGGMKEQDFYTHFGSFEALERSIWKSYITTVNDRLVADETYNTYSVREKILAFYFTLAETLKADRSLAVHYLSKLKTPGPTPGFMKDFKAAFEEWINAVLLEGKQTGEIAMRPYLDRKYDVIFWLHLLFILQFWVKDDTANFEKTDIAIEKSVNLAFDLLGKGFLDNAFDFGKFLYQSR
jgi:AcrR family transcriptional regulator